MDDKPTITQEGIRRVLEFLPLFEEGYDGELYKWVTFKEQNEVMQMPYVDYSPEVLRFRSALGSSGFIQPYDWMAWQEEASRYVNEPDLLKTAGLETLRKLFTLHVRRDRFVEGHFSEMIDTGHIRALLHRLKELSA
jgi:O-acetyl-ADP-ribose deacetylase